MNENKSINSLKKQLVAAVAMVLVAAVALGSSTYAWFVNNNKVTAAGMSVNATADDSLLIKGDNDSDFGSVGTTNISQTSMKPATSSDGLKFARLGANVVVKEKNNAAASWSGASGAFQTGDLVAVQDSEATTYYETATYTIKSITSAASIYVSNIDVTDTKDIFKATRVSVTITDSTGAAVTKVYNPKGNANVDNQVGSGESLTLVSDTSVYTATSNAALWSLAADTEYTVTIRVWFEGQDVNCFTDNIETTGTGITVDFSKYTA